VAPTLWMRAVLGWLFIPGWNKPAMLGIVFPPRQLDSGTAAANAPGRPSDCSD
jgi:hypothetical protein